MKEALIAIDHLSCTLGGKNILSDISLTIGKGEYISIVGPNGSGKTTLLKCLVRIITTWRGKVTISGKDLGRYSQRELARLVAYVPQADNQSSPFTVHEFVSMGRYAYLNVFSTASERDEEAVIAALETTGTGHLADRLLPELSGGERQKVYIAAALAQDAPVMLLDEPTTFLDPKHVSDITALLSRINKDHNVTIVAVTHDINGAAMTGGRVVALKEGSMVFSGISTEFMNDETLMTIYGMGFHFVEHPVTGTRLVVPEVER
jgi:iron complex transport system ATP-binding protein